MGISSLYRNGPDSNLAQVVPAIFFFGGGHVVLLSLRIFGYKAHDKHFYKIVAEKIP